MSNENDLSFLDKPKILDSTFPVAYSGVPQPGREEAGSLATHFIEVKQGVNIGCKFFTISKNYPTILYFHGNGETILDQDWYAVSYLNRKINFFAADYRGYGVSDGKPTISNLFQDAGKIFKEFKNIIREEGYSPQNFVMGRSLGSIPAVEAASRYQDEINGLILESGIAPAYRLCVII